MNSDNQPKRFKARLVSKDFTQEYGIDYEETFAPIVKQQSLRLLLAIAANENLIVHQIDISTAFLYGELDEDIYMEAHDGHREKIGPNQVLRLNKALYGLKQASRAWNKTLVKYLERFKLIQLKIYLTTTFNCIIIDLYITRNQFKLIIS